MSLILRPIFRDPAFEWIVRHHRHLKRSQASWLFGTSLVDETSGEIVGVVCVGRPPRRFQDGLTCEVTRVCTLGDRNACSMLYAAAIGAASSLGYRRVYTYTRLDEDGASCRSAGFVFDRTTRGGEATRPGRTRAPVEDPDPKRRYVWPPEARDQSEEAVREREERRQAALQAAAK